MACPSHPASETDPEHPELRAHRHAHYGPRELDALERWLDDHRTLAIEPLPNGLYRALGRRLPQTEYTGYQATWLRDTVHVAECLRQAGGSLAQAKNTATTLLAWFAHEAPRFQACIRGEADLSDAMQRPHIRFRGDTLESIEEPWSHAQNDALGITVWYCARLASEGVFEPTSEQVDGLMRAAEYFEAIRYERDRDSGHWEEIEKLQASSVGAVVAGLTALIELARVRPELRLDAAYLRMLVARGRRTLDQLLPDESRGHEDSRANRSADSALLFLIEPLQVVDDAMADRILARVERDLTGIRGIRRYRGDSYWMAGYPELVREAERAGTGSVQLDQRDAMFVPGSEAQWCLFDPVISVAYSRRFARTGDPRCAALAARHLRRSLAQITGPNCALGEGLCPEAYYRETRSEDAGWLANDDTPLAWVQAELTQSLFAARALVKAQSP